jgi:dTDP-4-dehydrorhamnose reductase
MVGTITKQGQIAMWLILGGEGQLGLSLQLIISQANIPFRAVGRDALDISNRNECIQVINELKPSVVVNCAAWTAVDLAEDHEEEAFDINCNGSRNVAIACRESIATLVHISTDYVFSGVSDTPYETDSPIAPTSAYGRSKLCGEQAVQQELPQRSYIFRTAWLYSQFRGNFVKTMVRKALTNSPVRVVSDQLGQPTVATDLAQHIVHVVESNAPFGIFHGTNSGQASWFELTKEIYSFLKVDTSLVTPVPTSEYPTRAVRPQYSVLSHNHTTDLGLQEMNDWKTALTTALPAIKEQILKEDQK